MSGKWRTFLRISGLIFVTAGVFSNFSGPWAWVLLILGLVQIIAAGGFG